MTNPQGNRTSFSLDGLSRDSVQYHSNGRRGPARPLMPQVSSPAWPPSAPTLPSSTAIPTLTTRSATASASPKPAATAPADLLTRLTSFVRELRSGIVAFAVTYAFDPAGNRTRQIDSGVITTSTYDNANELLVANTNGVRSSYSYDNSGNRTQVDAPGACCSITGREQPA